MRKKSKRGNARKFRFKSLFSRRRDDEGDWFRFEEESAPVRVSPRKRIRRRLLAAKVMALACLSVSVPLAAKWGYGEVFFKNEEFVLKSLQIQTDGVLSAVRLAEIANVAAGMNLMDLDLGQIQAQVQQLPQVEKATVARELPDRLLLTVRERIPVAWLSCPPIGIRPWDMERGFLLDEEGYMFRCLDLNDGMKSLPVVECFKLPEPVEGTRVESEGARAGLKLILASDARFLGSQDGAMVVRGVRVRDEWAVECDYASGLKATFGIYDFVRGLDDLALILGRMAESGRTIASVNLAAEKNIPVTFAVVATPVAASAPSAPSATPAVVEAVVATPDSQVPGGAGDGAISAVSAEQEKHLRSILRGG